MKAEEKCRRVADRIFYLSIPPSIFTTVAACASQAASSPCVAALNALQIAPCMSIIVTEGFQRHSVLSVQSCCKANLHR